MKITLNGEARSLAGTWSIADLLGSFGTDGVAVAVNGEVIPRSRHHDWPVRDGDLVEIVTAVQGG